MCKLVKEEMEACASCLYLCWPRPHAGTHLGLRPLSYFS